ncbi:MAG: hypothetical protein A3E83_03105 [Gammaproteobacteria bacterium RIFCSPHIGHO2_12_FULL_41_20]|nr:MAG: hypothetical protein A3E83_03105 [Gammaproteobacteria bacterium RIFCSPHIGHO2_12_FULL_41_20]
MFRLFRRTTVAIATGTGSAYAVTAWHEQKPISVTGYAEFMHDATRYALGRDPVVRDAAEKAVRVARKAVEEGERLLRDASSKNDGSAPSRRSK